MVSQALKTKMKSQIRCLPTLKRHLLTEMKQFLLSQSMAMKTQVSRLNSDNKVSFVGHFEVHPEAIKLLESIEGELGVVTIAGPYRTGKSSLAGRALLKNPKAF